MKERNNFKYSKNDLVDMGFTPEKADEFLKAVSQPDFILYGVHALGLYPVNGVVENKNVTKK